MQKKESITWRQDIRNYLTEGPKAKRMKRVKPMGIMGHSEQKRIINEKGDIITETTE